MLLHRGRDRGADLRTQRFQLCLDVAEGRHVEHMRECRRGMPARVVDDGRCHLNPIQGLRHRPYMVQQRRLVVVGPLLSIQWRHGRAEGQRRWRGDDLPHVCLIGNLQNELLQTRRKVQGKASLRTFQRVGHPVHNQHRSGRHIPERDDRPFANAHRAHIQNARILHDEIIRRSRSAEQVGRVQIAGRAGQAFNWNQGAVHIAQDLIGDFIRSRRRDIHGDDLRSGITIRIPDRDRDVPCGIRPRRAEDEVFENRLHIRRGGDVAQADLWSLRRVRIKGADGAPVDDDIIDHCIGNALKADGRLATRANVDDIAGLQAADEHPAIFKVAVALERDIGIQHLPCRRLCRCHVQRIDHVGQRGGIAHIHRDRVLGRGPGPIRHRDLERARSSGVLDD